MLAEETPAESTFLHEMEKLKSVNPRTPSPGPTSLAARDPNFLSPGSWNGDKNSQGGGGSSIEGSHPGSRPSSRPSTPSSPAELGTSPTPEPVKEELAVPSTKSISRSPSRQSNKSEQGTDLEIKPLQKMELEPKSTEPVSAPVRTRIISSADEGEPLPLVSIVCSQAEPSDAQVTQNQPEAKKTAQENLASITEDRLAVKPKQESSLAPRQEPSPARWRDPSPAPRLDPSLAPRRDPSPALRQEPSMALRRDPSPAPKRDPSPAPLQEMRPASRQESKPTLRRDPIPAPKAVAKPEPKPVPKVESNAITKMITKQASKSELRQKAVLEAPAGVVETTVPEQVNPANHNVYLQCCKMLVIVPIIKGQLKI